MAPVRTWFGSPRNAFEKGSLRWIWDLKDKRVLVTGSGSGIGKATARVYLEEGARVIVHGLTGG
jgi:glutamate dehydrogenase/leucine dehydrogenase